MKQQRFDEAQIIGILKQQESGVTVAQVCREHAISTPSAKAPFIAGKANMVAWKSTKPRACANWNRKTPGSKSTPTCGHPAESMLDNAALKDVLQKNGDARC